jgi:hypothetical protein
MNSQCISNVSVAAIDAWLVQIDVNCASLVAYAWRDQWPSHDTQIRDAKEGGGGGGTAPWAML